MTNTPKIVLQTNLICTYSEISGNLNWSLLCFFQELQSKSKVCANVFCGAGRECAVNEKGEPSCLCIEVNLISCYTRY